MMRNTTLSSRSTADKYWMLSGVGTHSGTEAGRDGGGRGWEGRGEGVERGTE